MVKNRKEETDSSLMARTFIAQGEEAIRRLADLRRGHYTTGEVAVYATGALKDLIKVVKALNRA